jgi:hypothetical protein
MLASISLPNARQTLIFTTKLFLLERGFLVEALGLDRLLARPVSDKRKEEDGSEDEEDVSERVTSDDQARLTNYVAAIQLDSSSDYRDTDGYQTGAAYEAKRTVIRQILATAISKTFCSKCSACVRAMPSIQADTSLARAENPTATGKKAPTKSWKLP